MARRRLALLGLLPLISPAADGRDWRVQPGAALEQVVADAAPGDTILIERGHYAAHLRIGKPLTLRGVNRPTLTAGGRGDVIRILGPDVLVEGLIIRDSGSDLNHADAGVYIGKNGTRARVRNCYLSYNLFGIRVEGAGDIEVAGNVVTGKRDLQSAQRGNGIQIYNTRGARILDNHISFVRDGIYVDVSDNAVFRGNRIHHVRYGTHYMNSHHNLWEGNWSYLNRGGLALMEVRDQTVRNNVTWGNTDHGIMLRTIQDSVIEGNIVIGNGKGFFVYDAEYNILRNNLVAENRTGVHLWAGSYRNQVDDNDFIGNEEQIRYVATRDERWGIEGGNYWSNYSGWDRDGDGRGDVRYTANDIVDRLVWRYPYVQLLLHSPAVFSLRLIAQQFPLLRAPSIVDERPRMRPLHADWRKWIERIGH
ncbi:MAG: putative ABC transporter binding protein NosD [Gammaproteobacteria bacterium]|nr:putative ABC transporter binding protein NosD [Gammaproteobacteria bacterium]